MTPALCFIAGLGFGSFVFARLILAAAARANRNAAVARELVCELARLQCENEAVNWPTELEVQ